MNKEDMAALLHGREYRQEISKEEQLIAEEAGLVVVFGASDDLMEFRGAIDDELDAYNGRTAYLNKDGLLENSCENNECPYHETAKKNASTVHQIWDQAGYSWICETTIPHSEFDIFEDGDTYCRGLVFNLEDAVKP